MESFFRGMLSSARCCPWLSQFCAVMPLVLVVREKRTPSLARSAEIGEKLASATPVHVSRRGCGDRGTWRGYLSAAVKTSTGCCYCLLLLLRLSYSSNLPYASTNANT